jgi:hypothetical protein
MDRRARRAVAVRGIAEGVVPVVDLGVVVSSLPGVGDHAQQVIGKTENDRWRASNNSSHRRIKDDLASGVQGVPLAP